MDEITEGQSKYFIRRPAIERIDAWDHGEEHILVTIEATKEGPGYTAGEVNVKINARLSPAPSETPLRHLERLADEQAATALEAIAAALRQRAVD